MKAVSRGGSAEEVVEAFAVLGAAVAMARLGIGRIHQTYLITRAAGRDTHRYILQRINSHVFGPPKPLMENIRRVTEHVRGRLVDEGRERASVLSSASFPSGVKVA